MMRYSNIRKEIEMELMTYTNTRTQLCDRIREHDILDLETKHEVERLKMQYEQDGLKSTQARYKAEQEKELQQKTLIELEHEINTLKARRDESEYRFTYLFRVMDMEIYEDGG